MGGFTGTVPPDVSALALEATLTAIKGAGWSTETLKAIKDAIDAVIPGVGDATQVKQDAIKAVVDAILVDTNTTLEAKLDAIKAVTDVLPDAGALTTLQNTVTGIQNDLDNAVDGLGALKLLIDAVQATSNIIEGYTDILDDATNGLANIKSLIDTLQGTANTIEGYTDILDDAINGLANIKSLIDTLQGNVTDILLDTGTTIPGTIATLQTTATGIQNDLSNATDGLGALKGLIDAAQADVTSIKAVTDLLPDGGALTTLITHLTDIKGVGWTTQTLVAIKAAVDAIIPGVGDATQAKQDAIEAKLDLPAANETANTKIGEVIGQKGDAANVTASQASIIGLLRAVITTYLADGTIGLANLQALLAAITAAGPTNAQMETARDAIITEVDANETKVDAVEAKVDLPAANATTNTKIGEVIGQKADVANETADEASIIGLLRAVITNYLNHGSNGLANLKTLIDAIETKLDTPANFMANLTTLETRLSAARAGYLDQLDFNLQEAIAALQTDLDNPAQFKADLSTLETRLSATRAGYLDQLDFNLAEAIAAIPTTAMRGTDNAMLAVNGALEATLTAIKGGGWATETLVAIKAAVDAIPGGDALEATSQLIKTQTDKIGDATIGLANLKALIDTLTGYVDAEVAAILADTGELQTDWVNGGRLDLLIDAIKAKTDLTALDSTVAKSATALSTAQWTNALATALGNYTAARAGYLDELAAANLPTDVAGVKTVADAIAVLADSKVMGRLQIATTTEDLNQVAGTYDLFTGTTQAVVLEKLNIKMPTGAAGGAITSIAIVTDDATPGTIISATSGAVANLTSETDLGWTGTLLINVGTKIRLTIAGGAHGSEYLTTVVAQCRAVVSGGYLA